MAETQPQATDGQAQAAVPATGDTVAATPPAQQTDVAQGGPVDSASEELQPPDDVKESWNTLPDEQRKLVNKIYTKTRQRDAEKLKQYEQAAQEYQTFVTNLRSNPAETLKALEAQVKAQGWINEQPQQQTNLSPQTEEVLAKASEHFGPEGAQLLRQLLQAEVAREVAPLKQAVHMTAAKTTEAETKAILAEFEAKHPGALGKYNDKMRELGLQLTDGGKIPTQMGASQWLEHLYRLVAFDDVVSAKVQETVTRMSQSARTEQPASAVPPSRVAKKAPSLDDFGGSIEKAGRAAGEAALRGDLWE